MLVLISGCCTKNHPKEHISQKNTLTTHEDLSHCEAWVYAPDHFVLELAAGASIQLDPKVEDFPLFCTAPLARQGLIRDIETKQLPSEGWALFKLSGAFSDLARQTETGFLLKRTAVMETWESLKN